MLGTPCAERMRSPYAHAAPGPALERTPAERRETPISRREEAESTSTSWTDVQSKARIARGRLLREKPFGVYAVELTAGGLLSTAYELAETYRERLQDC